MEGERQRMIYLYFDKQGALVETINQPLRKGSVDVQGIAVYSELFEDTDFELDDIWYCQKLPSGKITNETSFKTSVINTTVPYNPKADYKYFKDFQLYKFYVKQFDEECLSQAGLNIGTVRLSFNNSIEALGEILFNVQENIVKYDNYITQSQYDYLLLAYASRTLNEETGYNLNELIAQLIEENTRLEGISYVGTTDEILALTVDSGIALSTTNSHWFYWNDEEHTYEDSGNTFMDVSLASNIATLDSPQTFTGVKTFNNGAFVRVVANDNLSVVNKQYADAINSGAVHNTGNETIAGNKTFSGEVNAPLVIGNKVYFDSSSYLEVVAYDFVHDETINSFSIYGDRIDVNNAKIENVATPTNNNDAVNKAYADGKLAKVTTQTQVMQAYVKLDNGTNQMLNVHWDNIRDTIPIRDQTGNVRVSLTPTVITHATSKQYVDNLVAGVKMYVHKIECTMLDANDDEVPIYMYITCALSTAISGTYGNINNLKAYFLNNLPSVSSMEYFSPMVVAIDKFKIGVNPFTYIAYNNNTGKFQCPTINGGNEMTLYSIYSENIEEL